MASEDEEVGEQRFVDHTCYRHMIGEGFAQRQPSELTPSKPAYVNIDDQVARSLADSKFSANRQEYAITGASAFSPQSLTRRRRTILKRLKPAIQKTSLALFKQVSNNLGATSDI